MLKVVSDLKRAILNTDKELVRVSQVINRGLQRRWILEVSILIRVLAHAVASHDLPSRVVLKGVAAARSPITSRLLTPILSPPPTQTVLSVHLSSNRRLTLDVLEASSNSREVVVDIVRITLLFLVL